MKSSKLVLVVSSILWLALASGTVWAEGHGGGPCEGQKITQANHFIYGDPSSSGTTFSGTGGNPVTVTFTITAPSGGDVFPNCNTTDIADIFVQAVTQVADASGNPLLDSNGNAKTVDIIDTNPILAAQIAAAFSFNPPSHSFGIGEVLTVTVTVSNPNADVYGDYDIKMVAKEENPDNTGIGVASGSHFTLSLRAPAPSCNDTLAPTVTVTQPKGDQILGVIDVTATAIDPDTPPGCGTGVVSMSASVSSAKGAVSNQAISLTPSPGLPAGAGTLVTATGSFTPLGGTGPAGTVNGSPFTSSSLSGIGNYTITAQAKDGAGNVGTGTDNFNVSYDVSFANILVTGSHCSTAGNSSCQVHFEIDVNRSNVTSDGAFMVDETVVVKLKRTSDNTYVATHSYGCASPFANVQISTTTGVACGAGSNTYATNFKRGDLGASGPATYVAEVWFTNVDGLSVLQATSNSVTF